MENAISELFVILICSSPFLAGGGLAIWLVIRLLRGPTASGLSARIDQLDWALRSLRDENATLQQRVSYLESRSGAAESSVITAADSAPSTTPTEQAAVSEASKSDARIAHASAMATDPSADSLGAPDPGAEWEARGSAGPESNDGMEPEATGPDPAPTDTVQASPPAPSPSASAVAPGETASQTAAAGAEAQAPRVDDGGWERWIGVRGAAALGAFVLVIAGVFFFQYSIENGWLTPTFRVIAGTLVGLACVVGSESRLRSGHPVLANWLGGAGIAILYVAVWSGRVLFDLYPSWVATILMISVTVAGVTVALRRDAMAVAMLGLFGGLITPFALSTGEDRPIALFGYLFVLDAAMLWVAYRRRWSWMAMVAMVGTAVYQIGWLFGRMDEPRVLIGTTVLVAFGCLFAFFPAPGADQETGGALRSQRIWRTTRSAALIAPLAVTLGLATRPDLGQQFWPFAVQLTLLVMAAGWVGRSHSSPLLPVGAAFFAFATIVASALRASPSDDADAYRVLGLVLALALVFMGYAEASRWGEVDEARQRAARGAAAAALIGATVVNSILAGLGSGQVWSWFVGWVVLGALSLRLVDSRNRALPGAVGVITALGVVAQYGLQRVSGSASNSVLILGLAGALAFGYHLAALSLRHADTRRTWQIGANLTSLTMCVLVGMIPPIPELTMTVHVALVILGALSLFGSARLGSGGWAMAAALVTAFAHLAFTSISLQDVHPMTLVPLGVGATLGVVVAFTPTLARSAWSWRGATLGLLLYFVAAYVVHERTLGKEAIGLLPLAFAGLPALALALALIPRTLDGADETRKTATVWLAATALGFVTLAIPLQLDKEAITVGWSLEALALIVLWRRLDHNGLKYLAFALASAVFIRLCLNPNVLEYYPRSSLRIINWLSYTYLIPAACLYAMWILMRKVEVGMRGQWEERLYGARLKLAHVAATLATLVLFAWLNLTIIDFFAEGRALVLALDRLPARDLSLSIAWLVFALGLLGVGVWRRGTVLRVASLGLILITALKVFLYDLAYLTDLYRVASLVGLAASLIAISILYHRFVFAGVGRPRQARAEPAKPTVAAEENA